MTLRKITSLTTGINLVLMMLTSVILYIAPVGRVAYWANWKFLGLTKAQWGDLHLNLGILFLMAALLHTWFNWQMITSYLRSRTKMMAVFTADFSVALFFTLMVGLGTYLNVPPLSSVIDFGTTLKDTAAARYGEPPYGHAELSPLYIFVERVGIDRLRAENTLLQAGIWFENDRQSLLTIAENNDLSPKELYDMMKQGSAEAVKSFPDSPEQGFGKKTMADICATYHLDTATVLRAMTQEGLAVDPEKSLKDNAAVNNVESGKLFEILKSVANGS